MIFKVFWKLNGESRMGFIKANTRTGAVRMAEKMLRKECIVTGCVEGFAHQITPQSLTLNFPNTSDYDPAWNHPEVGAAQ
ncbi:MAG: hypothetical protein IKO55_07790 [Kiritimatiellae bacterium]|nr:hypothetical protein [Kiritimatiellia bacterium]